MRKPSKVSVEGAVMSTHNVKVPLPANLKYVSWNPFSRFLIGRFMAALVGLAGKTSAGTVLDVGCGEGLVLRQLGSSMGPREMFGLDLRLDLLNAAKRVAVDASFFAGSVYGLPFASRSFDLVVCTEVLEHVEDPGVALTEIARVADRFVILSVPREPLWRVANMTRGRYLSSLGNTPGHINHWSSGSFVRFVSRAFAVKDIRHPLPWTVVLAKVT